MAFKQDLSQKGKAELKQVLETRAKSFTQSVPYFAGFSEARRKRVWFASSCFYLNISQWNLFWFQIVAKNVPLIVQMQICTFFNPELTWRQQLTPVIGMGIILLFWYIFGLLHKFFDSRCFRCLSILNKYHQVWESIHNIFSVQNTCKCIKIIMFKLHAYRCLALYVQL